MDILPAHSLACLSQRVFCSPVPVSLCPRLLLCRSQITGQDVYLRNLSASKPRLWLWNYSWTRFRLCWYPLGSSYCSSSLPLVFQALGMIGTTWALKRYGQASAINETIQSGFPMGLAQRRARWIAIREANSNACVCRSCKQQTHRRASFVILVPGLTPVQIP